MENYKLGLNESQLKAVECAKNKMLLIAGAGSGKSLTLVRKVEYLLFNRTDPQSIFCISFTRAAANELKKRLEKKVKSRASLLNISTFHTFIIQFLKKHGNMKNTVFISNIEKSFLMDKLSKRYNLKKNLLETELKKSIISEKNSQLQYAINDYIFELNRLSLLDIDMLLPLFFNKLNTDNEFLSKVRNEIGWIFYDEAQDMNEIQYKIITKLISVDDVDKGLILIGDDDQNIYKWNGTSNKHLIRFKDDYNAEILILPENYRSTKEIVQAANNIISHGNNYFQKDLKAFRSGSNIEFLEFKNELEEMSRIAGICSSYIASDKSISILCRTNREVNMLSSFFKSIKLEHRTSTKVTLNEKILSQLSLCINLNNDILVKKFINYDKNLNLKAIETEKSISQILIDDGNKEISNYVKANEFQKYNSALASYDYIDNIFNFNDPLIRNAICSFEENSSCNSLEDFLIYLSTKSVQDDLLENKKNISIMTIHASKGLEFDTVIFFNFTDRNYNKKLNEIDENRCLVYVAVTRAKDNLIITYPLTQSINTFGPKKVFNVKISEFKNDLIQRKFN